MKNKLGIFGALILTFIIAGSAFANAEPSAPANPKTKAAAAKPKHRKHRHHKHHKKMEKDSTMTAPPSK